jgi:hypothetical protein
MKELWEATMQGKPWIRRFCTKDFVDPPFIRMLRSYVRLVMSRELESHLEEMRYL